MSKTNSATTSPVAADIAAERAAREAKKNRAIARRVNAWRKRSTGKRVL